MSVGLVGHKCGMSRVFKEDGKSIPVSVIEIDANYITQLKTLENDGYCAVQVGYGTRRASLINKSVAGHLAKANVEPVKGFCEFRLTPEEMGDLAVGQEISIEKTFTAGQKVDVQGVNKGKGFAGVIKRHNFRCQDATHGNSLSHRAPGSIGQRQTPGRVFKGKRMAGHMGDVTCTIQNLEIVQIRADKNLILVKGAIPGATGSRVIISRAVKA